MRRLAAAGPNLTGSNFGQTARGDYVVATERAPGDSGTLWAATRVGRVFVSKNADDAQPRNVRFNRIDTREHPGPLRLRDRGRPGRPEPRVDLVLGLRRVHAGHAGPRVRGPATTRRRARRRSPTARTTSATSRSPGSPYFGATGDVYAATDFGVLRLPRGASHWESAGSGLPSVAVYGLTLSQSANVLYAATHGRGAWALTLPRP